MKLLLSILLLVPMSCDDGVAAQSKPAVTSNPAMTTFPKYSKSGYDITPLSKEKIAEICKTLTPTQIAVTQNSATEPAFCGDLVNNKEKGVYVCVVGGLPLFKSGTKFDSRTGWPSFFDPVDPDHIIEKVDRTHGMVRVEILDARSGAHLGHVFDDGPPPTGKRYCLNSAALKFIPDTEKLPAESLPVKSEIAYFAGGCFWGVEDVFQQIPGVIDAVSGYQGGLTDNPTYQQVCTHTTGHAESVQVVFDPNRVSYRDLLKVFFDNHDATQLNRQGPDVGDQYRSAIFTTSEAQAHEAKQYIKDIQSTSDYAGSKIVTVIQDAPKFFPAEDYHQDYHKKHGGSCKVKR